VSQEEPDQLPSHGEHPQVSQEEPRVPTSSSWRASRGESRRTKGTNFQLMENIQRFQAAIKKYGVPEEEIFQTADLFEKRNIVQVTLCIYSLGR
ncbi:unnamed protein product, partial [Timema podura]|nr:unnamed protein product [Timema podura]